MSIANEIENLSLDISELTTLETSVTRDNVKKLIKNEITRLTQKKNNLAKQLDEQKSAAEKSVRSSDDYILIKNYAWDQSDEFVKIYIDLDKNCNINSTDVKLNFPNKKSFNIVFDKYKFSLSKLHLEIDSDGSYHKMTKSNKLLIYLKKSSKGKTWTNITEVDNPYKKTLEDDKEDLGDDPSASLMKLMKKMYDEGDDEMKRSIAKSWYESRQKNLNETVDMP